MSRNSLATALISDTVKAPWLQTVQLGDLLKDQASQDRRHATYPQDERGKELSSGYLNAVADTKNTTDGLASIYVKPRPNDFEAGLLGELSSAFRSGGASGAHFKARLDFQVDDTKGKVYLLPTKTAAIAGRSAQLPYTVVNNLPDPIRILVEASSHSNRLQVSGQAIPLTIDAGHKSPVNIGMRSTANGVTPVDINVLTPDRQIQMGDTVTTYVNTAGYVQTALIITGVGLAVLFVGVGVRFTRARKRRKQAEEHDAAGHPATDGGRTAG